MRFPNTVDDLIAALDARFPEVVPMPGDDPDEIMHAAGQRSVVAFLKTWRASVRTRGGSAMHTHLHGASASPG